MPGRKHNWKRNDRCRRNMALLTHPWVFVLWFAALWGVVDQCGSDRFVAVSGRGGFMWGAAALSWSTRSGGPALPAVVAREPPQGSPRQSADLTRTAGAALFALLGMVGV